MFSKTKRRIMSAFIATSMAMTPLLGYADLVRGDDESIVETIWAVSNGDGIIPESLTISDAKPGATAEGDYSPVGRYISNYEGYEITYEDEGLMILGNNSTFVSPPGMDIDYRLSGTSSVDVTGLMVASTDERFPAYEGDADDIGAILEFYTSGTYEDDEENDHYAERLDVYVYGDMDIEGWFSADDLTIEEGVLFNIGYERDGELHDGHVTAGHVLINGRIHIADSSQINERSEFMIFEDLSIGANGQLTAACNAGLVFGDKATCSVEGFPLKIWNGEGELVDFVLEQDHERVEFMSRPVDEQDPDTGIFWEYTEPEPERPEHTYCVDYDDRGGEASVTVGEGEPDAIIRRPWDPYEFETGTAVVFKLNPPQGYNLSTAIVEIVEFAEDEDVNYSSELDPSDPHYIEINREDGTFAFTTSCYGYDVFISWSAYEFRFDRDSHFVVETHANDKGSVVFVDDSACERIEEDPYCPGNFRYLFNYDVFDEGNTLQIKFVPNANCVLQDIGINLNGTETFYARENRPDHPTILFEDAQNLTDNGDGTYTWTISASSDWNEWYNVNTYFEKVINVSGIELEARDATKIEYSLDGGAYTTLESSMIGEGDGAHEGYYVSPETLDGHDSITFRFTYDNGVIKEGVRVEYAQNSNRKIDILPFDNDSNPYEFTLNKTGTTWNDYGIQVNDWPTPFNGTYLVTRHGPGDVVVTGVDMDVLSDYEDGQTLTFTVSCDEGIYKVVGRYSNDPNNGEFDIPCNEGTYTIQPNGGGLDIMIYTTQEEYNIDHLNANYGNGEFDFEIFVHEHGFHENNAQFDGEFTFVEDEEHIKAFAASGNRTRFVVTFTDTELQTGKAKITLNLIPKYDCVYEVFVGEDQLEIVNGQVEIDLANVISGEHLPINIDAIYEEPIIMEAWGTSEQAYFEYSFDGETYYSLGEDNTLNLKEYASENDLYLKAVTEEGIVATGIRITDLEGNDIAEVELTDGVYKYSKETEWTSFAISLIYREAAGQFTVNYAREEDSSAITFSNVTPGTPVTYYGGEDTYINIQSGTVYKAVAVNSATGASFDLVRVSGNFLFAPQETGDYEITFYVSEAEYVFENVEGTDFAYVNVVDMTSTAGSVSCTGSTAYAMYNGCMKFAVTGTEAEIVIEPSEAFEFTVDLNDSGATLNDNKLTVSTSATKYPIITFSPIPDLGFDYEIMNRDFTVDAGTEVTMVGKVKETGVTGLTYVWSKSTDGENYTVITGAESDTYTDAPIRDTEYKLEVTDSRGRTIFVTFTVTVTLPEIKDNRTDAQKNYSAVYGDDVQIDAEQGIQVTGPRFAWYVKEGTEFVALTGETGSKLSLTGVTASGVYKCVVTDAVEQTLELEYNVNVTYVLGDTTDPDSLNVTITSGDSTTLTVSVDTSKTDGTVQYAWASSADGETYTAIEGTEASVSVSPTADTYYKCTVSDGKSESLEIVFNVTVNPKLEDARTTEQMTANATYGDTVSFTSVTTNESGATYQWYKGSVSDANMIAEATAKTYEFTAAETGTYICKVTDVYGASINLSFELTLSYALDVTAETTEYNIYKTDSATLTVNIDSSKTDEVAIAWLSSSDGENFSEAVPNSDDLSSITVTPETTTYYKCLVEDPHGNSKSVVFTVTVTVPVISDTRTDDEKTVVHTYGTSTVLEAKTDAIEPTYQWYMLVGETFCEITDATESTCTIEPEVGTTYRCTVTDKYGTSIELDFTCTVNYVLTDNTSADSKNVTIIKTESATLAPVIDSSKTSGVTYAWFTSQDGTTYSDSSFSTVDSVTVVPSETTYYKCVVADEHNNSVTIIFTVNVTIPEIVDQRTSSEKSLTLTYGESKTLTAKTNAIEPTYSWLRSTDGSSFTTISGETGSTLSIKPDANYTYRCSITDKYGTKIKLDYTVKVNFKLTDNTASSAKSVTITKFDSTTLEAKVSENTTTGVNYTWYSSTDGKTFTKMSDTTKSVKVTPSETTTYKCEVKDAHGNTVNVIFKVTVNVPVLKDLTSASAKTVTTDKDKDVTLEVKVNDTETTGIKYKWYKSTNGTSFNIVTGEKSGKITFKADSNVTYSCTVTDKYGNSIEVVFKVTVNEPATPTPDPDSESFGGFVERLYNVALGRESEPEGKEFWVKNVEAGNLTGADAAREFLNSKEFKDKGLTDEQFLAVLYETFFNRNYKDDPNGFNFWMNSLKSVGRDKVVDGFINSEEWCNICAEYGIRSGATTAKATKASKNAIAFAERLYTCCLGREAETDGLNFWSLSLTNLEVSGSEAARQFFTSAEFKGFNTSNEEYIKRLYTTFMGREYDEGGLNYWLGEMKNGMSREQVFDNFASSKEFTDICNSYGIQR